MTVGMILECGPQGADQQVCEELARRCAPETPVVSVTLDRKPRVIAECGRAAARLLAGGCDRVLIVWDLYPAWREKGERPCRKEDRQGILESLEAARVNAAKVALICVQEELEAWLIADGRAISAVLSTPAHPVRVPDTRRPDQVRNPKKHLNRLFKKHRGWAYIDLQHAIKIARALPDLNRLNRIASFRRFAANLA